MGDVDLELSDVEDEDCVKATYPVLRLCLSGLAKSKSKTNALPVCHASFVNYTIITSHKLHDMALGQKGT